MEKLDPTVAHKIAQLASNFELKRSGRRPKSVTVVLSENTIVITLHGTLTPAEKALAQTPEGAAQVQEFHKQLFNDTAGSLREEIKKITGVEVRDAVAEIEPATGMVLKVFTTGAVVQVFLMADNLLGDTWSGNKFGNHTLKMEV
jgi:uncharacterized protein YbcI